MATQSLFDDYVLRPSSSKIEAIESKDRIIEVLVFLLRNNAKARFLKGRYREKVQLTAVDSQTIQLDRPVTGPGMIEIEGFSLIYRFNVSSINSSNFPLPQRMDRIRHRWNRRAKLAQAIEIGKDRVLKDLSYGGFSFTFNPENEKFQVGDRPSTIEIHKALLQTEVRSVVVDGAKGTCRMAILSSPNIRVWYELVDRHLHPETFSGANYLDELWSLYEKCGYFGLGGKGPDDFSDLKVAFKTSTQRLNNAGIGHHSMFRSENAGVFGSISALKIHSGTWMGLQLAKITGDTPEGVPGRNVLRQINSRVYEMIQRDTNAAWIVTYLQVKRVWSRLLNHDFLLPYISQGAACVLRFKALELQVPKNTDVQIDTPVVGRATPLEIRSILSWLKMNRPAAYLEAFDLTPKTFDMNQNIAEWSDADLVRDRATFVVRSQGRMVAAAVAEIGADGTHLFGFLDLVRLYVFEPNSETLVPKLIERVTYWYGASNKSVFKLFLEEDVMDLQQILSIYITEDMGPADYCIVSSKLLPEMMEFLYEVTSPKEILNA